MAVGWFGTRGISTGVVAVAGLIQGTRDRHPRTQQEVFGPTDLALFHTEEEIVACQAPIPHLDTVAFEEALDVNAAPALVSRDANRRSVSGGQASKELIQEAQDAVFREGPIPICVKKRRERTLDATDRVEVARKIAQVHQKPPSVCTGLPANRRASFCIDHMFYYSTVSALEYDTPSFRVWAWVTQA